MEHGGIHALAGSHVPALVHPCAPRATPLVAFNDLGLANRKVQREVNKRWLIFMFSFC